MRAAPLWLTAREIAEAMIPGLPTSPRGVKLLAEREGWAERPGFARPRQGRGGGLEYRLDMLAPQVREAFAEQAKAEEVPKLPVVSALGAMAAPRALPALPSPLSGEAALIRLAALPAAARAQAEARARLLAALEARLLAGGSLERAAEALAAGERFGLEASDFEAAAPLPSAAGLRRWRRLLREEGAAALADGRGRGRPERSSLAEPARRILMAVLAQHPDCRASQVASKIRETLGEAAVPDARALQRALKDWRTRNRALHALARSPDDFRSRFRLYGGSASEAVVRLNQLWEIDSTAADLMTADGKRLALVQCLDVFTRRSLILVAETSSALAVGACLRRAMLEWGVPEAVKTDNGKDYVSNHVLTALRDLQIEHIPCEPFRPEQKPHVERAFRSFSHGLFELLPGFAGHDVAQAQAIRSRRSFAERMMRKRPAREAREEIALGLTAAELQTYCDWWRLGPEYGQKKHASLGCSPLQKAASWPEEPRRIADERALDLLLLPVVRGGGLRKVGKMGIKAEGGLYQHPALQAWSGRELQVRLDPADAGRIWAASPEGEFIAWAIDPVLSGIERKEFARDLHVGVAAQTKLWRRQLREMREGRGPALRLVAPTPEALPEGAPRHDPEAARAAIAAAQARAVELQPAPALRADVSGEDLARFAARMEAPEPAPETPRERYHRWATLEARAARGEALTDREESWRASYPRCAEARSLTHEISHHGYAVLIGKPDPRDAQAA